MVESQVSLLSKLAFHSSGGLALGALCGYLCFRMLKEVNDYVVEILLTLALFFQVIFCTITTCLAPLFAVVAGLMIGNVGKNLA